MRRDAPRRRRGGGRMASAPGRGPCLRATDGTACRARRRPAPSSGAGIDRDSGALRAMALSRRRGLGTRRPSPEAGRAFGVFGEGSWGKGRPVADPVGSRALPGAGGGPEGPCAATWRCEPRGDRRRDRLPRGRRAPRSGGARSDPRGQIPRSDLPARSPGQIARSGRRVRPRALRGGRRRMGGRRRWCSGRRPASPAGSQAPGRDRGRPRRCGSRSRRCAGCWSPARSSHG